MTLFSDTETWIFTDEQITARVVETFRAKAQVEAECATLMSAVQDRGLVKLSGSSSDTAWLSNLTGVSRGEASRTVRQGENLNEDVEPTRRVWAAGDLTSEKATTICKTINPPSTSCREVPPHCPIGSVPRVGRWPRQHCWSWLQGLVAMI